MDLSEIAKSLSENSMVVSSRICVRRFGNMKMEKRFELTAKEMKLHQEALAYARQHSEASSRGTCLCPPTF
jgi:hypothetical protein